MFSTIPFRTQRLISALVVLTCAVMLVAPLALPAAISPEKAWIGALVFYAVTAGSYGALPFIRRGDIAAVAMWLMLAVGVALSTASMAVAFLLMGVCSLGSVWQLVTGA